MGTVAKTNRISKDIKQTNTYKKSTLPTQARPSEHQMRLPSSPCSSVGLLKRFSSFLTKSRKNLHVTVNLGGQGTLPPLPSENRISPRWCWEKMHPRDCHKKISNYHRPSRTFLFNSIVLWITKNFSASHLFLIHRPPLSLRYYNYSGYQPQRPLSPTVVNSSWYIKLFECSLYFV